MKSAIITAAALLLTLLLVATTPVPTTSADDASHQYTPALDVLPESRCVRTAPPGSPHRRCCRPRHNSHF